MSTSPAGTGQCIRFGPFEFNIETGELRKRGIRVRLQRKSALILQVLVSRPGELVTREELKRLLWPNGTFVEFESSLNVAVRRLREILGDDAQFPTYVETVPRCGYRYVGPMKRGSVESPGNVSESSGNSSQQKTEVGQNCNAGAGYPLALLDFQADGGRSSVLTTEKAASRSVNRTTQEANRRMWALLTYMIPAIIIGITLCWLILPAPSPKVVDSTQLTHENRELGYGLLTDGSNIFFEEMLGDRQEIARVPVRGGETTFIPTPFHLPLLVGIVPDKTALIIADKMDQSTATLWRLPLHGGPLQPLEWLTKLHTFHFSFSPDAKSVAFIHGNPSSLAIVPMNSDVPHQIFSANSGYMHSPRWSPDGKSISFAWFDPEAAGGTGAESEWTISPDGSDAKVLVPQESAPSAGAWMPDGKHLVFASSKDGKRDVWTITRESWLARPQPRASRLTNGTLFLDAPLPSADGRKVFVFGKQNLGQVVRYDRNTNSFSPYLGEISANQIDFSRNGEWITYISYPEETIWRSRVDGTDKRQLTYSSMSADSPHWSPDGQRIAYRAIEPGQPGKKIYLISRDGGVPQELFPDDTREEGVPTWSPDGNRLVFGELRYHPEKIAIHIVDVNTREVTTVPSSQGLWTPRWSPDGRYLVALEPDATTFISKAILLYDFKREKWRKLTEHPVSDVAWSHDGQYIYFDLCNKPATDALFRVRVSDGQLEKIVDLRAFQRSPGGETGFSLAPDDSLVFLKEARQKEVYALEVR